MELDHAKISRAFNWTIKYMLAMQRGSTVHVNDVPVKDKSLLVEMVKAYIDCYQDAEFNENYTVIKKLSNWNTNK